MGSDGHESTILVVEDEEDLALLYATWLEESYDVLMATSGTEALELLSPAVDVALLDRRMPSLTGDEVLEEIRARDIDCRCAMITAVEPDLDVIDMPFDDYLVKPVTGDELVGVVEVMLRRSTYDERTQEFFRLASKKAALEAASNGAIQDRAEYRDLTHRMEELRGKLNQTLSDLNDDDFEAAFRALPGGEEGQLPQ